MPGCEAEGWRFGGRRLTARRRRRAIPYVTTHVNGVDVQKRTETVETLKSNPKAGLLRHRAHNRWVEGAHCRTRIQDFALGGEEMSRSMPFEIHSDEPPTLLGLSEEVRNGYSKIHITFHVKADASDEKLKELCEVAKQRPPVFDMISHGVPIGTSCERRA